MTFEFCASNAIVIRAGANVNSTAAASWAILSTLHDQAAGYVQSATLADWKTNLSSQSSAAILALQKAVACEAAKGLISYDMSGYTSRVEAQTMLDVLRDEVNQTVQALVELKTHDIEVM